MLSYTIKRIGLAVAVIAVAMAILFVMIYVIPGDPARVALGPKASPALVAEWRARMGVDQPVWAQIVNFYVATVSGNLGTDILSNRSVVTVVMEQVPFTLALIFGSMIWSILIGVPLGCLSAAWRGSFIDRLTGVLSVSVIAVPSFVVAIYALLFFAIGLRWFPAIGAGDGLADQLHHLILPSLALGLGWVGYLARIVRASMLEVLGENHVRTARAFGLPERTIIFSYVLRIAILPTVTLLGIGIGGLLSGAVFAEIVFARPGVGKLVYDAIATRNYPVISGAVLMTTAFFVFVTLIADLIVAGLDPRVRHGLQH